MTTETTYRATPTMYLRYDENGILMQKWEIVEYREGVAVNVEYEWRLIANDIS